MLWLMQAVVFSYRTGFKNIDASLNAIVNRYRSHFKDNKLE